MVLDKWALHEVLNAEERILIVEDNVVLSGTFRCDAFRDPSKTLLRIGDPVQRLSFMGHTRPWFESWEYLCLITEIFGRLK